MILLINRNHVTKNEVKYHIMKWGSGDELVIK